MVTTSTLIPQLHAILCSESPESACALNMHREHEWFDWLRWRKDKPFTGEDLKLVLAWRRRQVAGKPQFLGMLKFSHVVGRPDWFEEDLTLALAQRAGKVPATDLNRVLSATCRPPVEAKAKTQPAKLAGPLALAALEKLKEAVR